ncbi:MAG: hypothetical protein QXX01_03320 [Candidatus Aenigmatarchaeota archaeon]
MLAKKANQTIQILKEQCSPLHSTLLFLGIFLIAITVSYLVSDMLISVVFAISMNYNIITVLFIFTIAIVLLMSATIALLFDE